MTFNSFAFAKFFIVVYLAYLLLRSPGAEGPARTLRARAC